MLVKQRTLIEVYRFQNTPNLERHSYLEDLVDIWFSLSGPDREAYGDVPFMPFDEYCKEYLEQEPKEVLDEVFEEHKDSLSLRDNIGARELFNIVINTKTQEEAMQLQYQYKLSGVFAVEKERFQTLEEAFVVSQAPELGLSNRYLIGGIGAPIWYKDGYGVLVDMREITEAIEVPKQYHKELPKSKFY